MNFHLKSRGVEGMEELESIISDKMTRFERVLPENSYIEIELKQFAKAQGNGDKEAEVIADLPGCNHAIRFTAQAPTFLEAVDIVLDKLDTEVSREKDKRVDHGLHHKRPLKEVVADISNRAEL